MRVADKKCRRSRLSEENCSPLKISAASSPSLKIANVEASRPQAGPVGYAWLQDRLALPELLGTPGARIGNVGAIQRLPEGVVLVPVRSAPAGRWLDQILFALKHEGVNLHLLALALKQVQARELLDEFARTPNGLYIRKACFLWEQFTGLTLELPAGRSVNAGYTPMFEPDSYATGRSRRNPKWRIDFNGLGDLRFCPIVRLTPALKALLAGDLLGQARAFAAQTGQAMLDRALSWAYLSETEGSFAIEGEVPSQSKAAAFARLLKHAHEPRQLTEEYLVSLHNTVITNPLDLAVAFRHEQNRLQGAARGAAGVTYVPPEPGLAAELMERLMQLANEPPESANPLVHAALVSFGFVFIHPFMDGNGRLSRFLIHHCLGQSGQLPKRLLLPVSVAMKRHEAEYLDALCSFSRPARELCDVTWLGGADYAYDWKPDADLAFRYIDTTAGVEFTLRMARIALEQDLRRETRFLADYDQVHRAIDEAFDIRGPDLATLILCAFEQGGRLSQHRRKQYALRVPAATLDAIEAEVRRCLQDRADDTRAEAPPGPDTVPDEPRAPASGTGSAS